MSVPSFSWLPVAGLLSSVSLDIYFFALNTLSAELYTTDEIISLTLTSSYLPRSCTNVSKRRDRNDGTKPRIQRRTHHIHHGWCRPGFAGHIHRRIRSAMLTEYWNSEAVALGNGVLADISVMGKKVWP